MRKRDWTPEELSLLGQIPDAEIARRLGVSRKLVIRRRHELGIPSVPRSAMQPPWNKREWKAEELRLLGSVADFEIVRRVGLGRNTVIRKRKELGIPASPRVWRSLPKRIVARLGKEPDPVLARRAGVKVGVVRAERRKRGIPPCVAPPKRVEWTAEKDALLGQDSDARVGAELGVSYGTVARRRRVLGIPPFVEGTSNREWTKEELGLLGLLPDLKVARLIGCSSSAVLIKRQELGIEPSRKTRPVEWTSEKKALLGALTDKEVAERLSLTRNQVARARYRFGIPGWPPGRRRGTR